MSFNKMHQWHIYKTSQQASTAAATYLESAIRNILKTNSQCNIALPGGNSPVECLKIISTKDLPWEKIHWYLGDERCYPVGHDDRNDTMIREYLWSAITIQEENIHPIPTELGADKAAEIYSAEIEKSKGMDIVMLGMGEDGHTASLFPNNAALENQSPAIPVYESPKPPSDRVSLSINTIRQAKYKLVLTFGASKQQAITQVKNGDLLPINRLGDLDWFIDEAAIGNNE